MTVIAKGSTVKKSVKNYKNKSLYILNQIIYLKINVCVNVLVCTGVC